MIEKARLAVLESFRDVRGRDRIRSLEIRDRSGDFDRAVIRARGETEAAHGLREEFFACRSKTAMCFEQANIHLGIHVNNMLGLL